MIVADILDKRVFTIRPGASLARAASVMRTHRVTGLPVTDAAGRLVGVVTHNDLVRRREMDAESRPQDWPHKLLAPVTSTLDYIHMHSRHVYELMNPAPLTVTPAVKLYRAVELMNEQHVKRLPVLQNGHLVGMITKYDVMPHLAAYV